MDAQAGQVACSEMCLTQRDSSHYGRSLSVTTPVNTSPAVAPFGGKIRDDAPMAAKREPSNCHSGHRPWTPEARWRRSCLPWCPQGKPAGKCPAKPPVLGPTQLCWAPQFLGICTASQRLGLPTLHSLGVGSDPSKGPFSMSPGCPVASTSSQQPW